MTDLKVAFRLAKQWRSEHPELKGGWVVVYANAVTGWKKDLRDPGEEIAGVLAIGENEEVFVAAGGDEQLGACRWEKFE